MHYANSAFLINETFPCIGVHMTQFQISLYLSLKSSTKTVRSDWSEMMNDQQIMRIVTVFLALTVIWLGANVLFGPFV